MLIAAAALFTACSDDCSTKSCKSGITLFVGDLVGSLARGSQVAVKVCLDDECRDLTISRADGKQTVFVAFDGVGKDGDHELRLTSDGSISGSFTGALPTLQQLPNGKDCSGSCAIASVRVSADGTLTPGTPVVPNAATTTTTT